MHFISLTIRNYRVHKDLRLDFDRSRNLIGGPNESGKSTLVEAAHRALFLRAKSGGVLREEMRSTVHSGEPEVVLAFEAAGKHWTLEKHFAGARGSTLLTDDSGSALRDDAADEKLSGLLKAESGGRANASQLAAAWSLLWVWQGRAGDDPSAHTTAHRTQLIQQLQKGGVAAVLQSANDQRVASRISDTYNELFTTRGLKANSKPDVARIRLEEAVAALDKAREASARLAQAAADHARADRDIAEITALLPKLREERSGTETKLKEVAILRRDEATYAQAHQAATGRFKELQTHDQTIRELQAQLVAQTAALKPADEQLAALIAAKETVRNASHTAEACQREAAENLRRARLQNDLAAAAVASFEKIEAHQQIAKRAGEAEEILANLASLRSDLAKLPVLDANDLARLRKLETEVGQATAALEAMATGVELLESPAPVQLDGETLAPGETRILTEAAELVIGEGTRLRIRPGGGNSLATARTRSETARETLYSALANLAIRDMDHATSGLEQRQALGQKIDGLENRWQALGGESVATELSRATAERDAAQEEFIRRRDLAAATTPVTAPEDLVSANGFLAAARDGLTNVEAGENTARQQSTRLREKFEAATIDLTRHRDQTAAARQALRDLESAIKAREEAHGDETKRSQAIAAARETETKASTQLNNIGEALAALNPDQLTADLDRFSRALTAQESRLRQAEDTHIRARVVLTLDGSSDPEADLRQAEARHHAASEHHASELRRAQAIESLHKLFNSSREGIDNALVQPLADRITGYLACLFGPGTEARVQLSESGIEGLELVRPGTPAFSFGSLSGGAREQTAAAVRLALAEILAADHDGCLPVIFDDAFAYSDPDRIQTLQRMLDLAAVRGLQIVVLTCAPADYSAFGAAETRLCPIKSQQ